MAAEARAEIPPEVKRHRSRRDRFHCRQLDETTDDFLARLPPSSTHAEDVAGWIWVENPYDPGDGKSDIKGYIATGQSLLDDFRSSKARAATDGKGAKTCTANTPQEDLALAIKNAAKAHGVMSGKWMLFPHAGYVDEVWRKVVEGTAQGKLGIGAKVASKGSSEAKDRSRLICVCTRDFTDQVCLVVIDHSVLGLPRPSRAYFPVQSDIKRVVHQMKEMDLVGKKRIYYKADAYTHLELNGGNEYGLRPSIYGSHEMLDRKSISSPFIRKAAGQS